MEIHFVKKNIKDNQIIPVDIVQDKPTIRYNFKKGKLYTLIMVDHDAPSPENPINKYFLHWIMINIDDKGLGDEPISYKAANPPEGSGLHRYTFMLFEQKYVIEPKTILSYVDKKRVKFSPKKFTKRFDLNPVASITFKTQRE